VKTQTKTSADVVSFLQLYISMANPGYMYIVQYAWHEKKSS
jgi:hypothetical protein